MGIEEVFIDPYQGCEYVVLGIVTPDGSMGEHPKQNGPCKIVYDCWYKNRQYSGSFSGNTSDILSVALARAKPHKGYVTERVRSSVA